MGGLHNQTGPAPTDPQQAYLRMLKLFLSGGAAGAVSRTATAPIDRVKMLLQVSEGRQRMSILQGVQQMASEGGIKTYFKGNGANVLKIAPETALKLTINDRLKATVSTDPHNLSSVERVLAGGLAGGIAQGTVYPLEMLRTRLAVSPKGMYEGIGDAAFKVYRLEGPRAFYRGFVPSMVGILPYAGVDIAVFETCYQHLHDVHGHVSPGLTFLTGMISSTTAQAVAYPLALIRTRLQAQGMGNKPNKYNGMVDVAVKTVQREGVVGLYKGIIPNMLKLAPAAGLNWLVFEETKLALGLDTFR